MITKILIGYAIGFTIFFGYICFDELKAKDYRSIFLYLGFIASVFWPLYLLSAICLALSDFISKRKCSKKWKQCPPKKKTSGSRP